ncbi:hypothetical protein [Planotetraspora sp. GP83]|uniref:hypothetical protein n=1 Tax=Planotetraspora sp. GP83 TaxID=3156264 RepID=UPI0035129F5D
MDLWILCARCHSHVPGVEIEATSSLLKHEPDDWPPGGIPGASQRCWVCGFMNGPEVVRESLAALWLINAKLERAERERLLVTIKDLVRTQADLAAALARIESEQPQLSRLRRLIPHGQANVLAFLALVIGLATLTENTLADRDDLRDLLVPKNSSQLSWISYPGRESLYQRKPASFVGQAALSPGRRLCVVRVNRNFPPQRPAETSYSFNWVSVSSITGQWVQNVFVHGNRSLVSALIFVIIDPREWSAQTRMIIEECQAGNSVLTREVLALVPACGPMLRWRHLVSGNRGDEIRIDSSWPDLERSTIGDLLPKPGS